MQLTPGALGSPQLDTLRAQPTSPSNFPHPLPRAAATCPQAQQPLPAEAAFPSRRAAPAGLLLPHTQRSAAAPAGAQPFPRRQQACQPWKVNNVHQNSTYSGSLLHNNRHLTQGSPDFTDSKGKRGREESAGEGSQRDGGDRARPALVTGVQNGPELQLQVKLSIFRADAISPLPTSCLVQLDTPIELILFAKESSRATLGLGSTGQPWQHLLAPSGSSPKLLASRAEVFLCDASWVYWQGAAVLYCPGTAQPLWGQT